MDSKRLEGLLSGKLTLPLTDRVELCTSPVRVLCFIGHNKGACVTGKCVYRQRHMPCLDTPVYLWELRLPL